MDRKLKLVLASLAAAVLWGYVIWIFVSPATVKNSTQTETPENKEKSDKLYSLEKIDSIATSAMNYKSEIKKYIAPPNDPLGGYDLLKLTTTAIEKVETETKAPVQSQIRLLGIVWDDEQPYALVAHANGRSYQVKTGEVVEDEKIIKIYPDKIETYKEGVRFEITTSGALRLTDEMKR